MKKTRQRNERGLTVLQDMLIKDIELIYKNPPKSNEDFYAFIKDVTEQSNKFLELHEESLTLIK